MNDDNIKISYESIMIIPKMEWCVECETITSYSELEFCEICDGPICKKCITKKGNNTQIEFVICNKCQNI